MKETLKPIFVLTGICLIVAVLLAATNGITAPIIAANAEATAQQTRLELLPEADNFEVVPVEAEGVTEAARAENGAGWVITAQAQGYGGMVPVMVAFGEDGTIRAVQFLANDETPGLGQKVRNEDCRKDRRERLPDRHNLWRNHFFQRRHCGGRARLRRL